MDSETRAYIKYLIATGDIASLQLGYKDTVALQQLLGSHLTYLESLHEVATALLTEANVNFNPHIFAALNKFLISNFSLLPVGQQIAFLRQLSRFIFKIIKEKTTPEGLINRYISQIRITMAEVSPNAVQEHFDHIRADADRTRTILWNLRYPIAGSSTLENEDPNDRRAWLGNKRDVTVYLPNLDEYFQTALDIWFQT